MVIAEGKNVIIINNFGDCPTKTSIPSSSTNTYIKDRAVKAGGNFYYINYNLEIFEINGSSYEAKIVDNFKKAPSLKVVY